MLKQEFSSDRITQSVLRSYFRFLLVDSPSSVSKLHLIRLKTISFICLQTNIQTLHPNPSKNDARMITHLTTRHPTFSPLSPSTDRNHPSKLLHMSLGITPPLSRAEDRTSCPPLLIGHFHEASQRLHKRNPVALFRHPKHLCDLDP